MISYEEFEKKGYFVIPTEEEWENYPVGLREFYDDPNKYSLKTTVLKYILQKLR